MCFSGHFLSVSSVICLVSSCNPLVFSWNWLVSEAFLLVLYQPSLIYSWNCLVSLWTYLVSSYNWLVSGVYVCLVSALSGFLVVLSGFLLSYMVSWVFCVVLDQLCPVSSWYYVFSPYNYKVSCVFHVVSYQLCLVFTRLWAFPSQEIFMKHLAFFVGSVCFLKGPVWFLEGFKWFHESSVVFPVSCVSFLRNLCGLLWHLVSSRLLLFQNNFCWITRWK